MAVEGIYPKKEGEKVYYIRRLGYMFSLPLLDEKGERIPETNPNTGLQIRDVRGQIQYLETSIAFTPWRTRFCEEGYVAVYVVTKDTPKQIADALEADAKNRKSEVLDEESYIQIVNPDLFKRIGEDREKDAKIAAATAETQAANAEIERLRKMLGQNQQKRP
jgi:hypothetical protein